jgi:predicted RNase H-like HicB family nuclease
MNEVVFIVTAEDDGGYSATCSLPDGLIATQGDDWDDLEHMVRDAVACHFGKNAPNKVRLRLIKESVLSLAIA